MGMDCRDIRNYFTVKFALRIGHFCKIGQQRLPHSGLRFSTVTLCRMTHLPLKNVKKNKQQFFAQGYTHKVFRGRVLL